MYLISIYFDDKTNYKIEQLIRKVAEKSGNTFMLDGKVPPHITISAFETKQEEIVIEKLEQTVEKMGKGTINWASVGVFLPYVLYLAPVLSEYLHGLSVQIHESVKNIEETKISPYYRPFQWIPHTTVGKKLEKEEMLAGFAALQNSFGMFEGNVVRIGLAKTNPYREIKNWELFSGKTK